MDSSDSESEKSSSESNMDGMIYNNRNESQRTDLITGNSLTQQSTHDEQSANARNLNLAQQPIHNEQRSANNEREHLVQQPVHDERGIIFYLMYVYCISIFDLLII